MSEKEKLNLDSYIEMKDGCDRLYSQVRVQRPIYRQDEFNEKSSYHIPKRTVVGRVKNMLSSFQICTLFSSIVPASKWIPEYDFRNDLIWDFISGMTVAILHIPQGLAYGVLGNVDPIVGIYMGFFPVLIYFFFGTSRHVSIGTFAVVCLMTGKIVTKYSDNPNSIPDDNSTIWALDNIETQMHYSPIAVATAVTMMVGIYQIIMYIFRLGIISTILSETLVNAFITAAAVYVSMTQIVEILGLKLQKHRGPGKLIFACIGIVKNLNTINYAAVIVSAICILLLEINNVVLKPKLAKYTRMPVPIELIAIVIGTIMSKVLDLGVNYDLKLVGDIPTGLPLPSVPSIDLLQTVAVDAIAVTMVSYTISLSMAMILASNSNYEIDSNQELLAIGVSNICGSFFSCLPITASLSRSLIQQVVGGKTQIASIFSCAALLIVLLWIGPFFEPLPRCILASIIIVALKGLFKNASAIVNYWNLSKLDALVWIVTFLTVVLVDIDIGLLCGVVVSLLIILIKGLTPYTCLLGLIPDTDLYVDTKRYNRANDIPNIKIFHYSGGLSFMQCNSFKTDLYSKLEIDPVKVLTSRTKELKRREQHSNTVEQSENPSEADNFMQESSLVPFKCLIWDLSGVSYIDPAGVKQLHTLADEFRKIGVTVFIAGPSGPVFETLAKCEEYEKSYGAYIIFPTVHDAVLYAQETVLEKT